MSPPPSIDPLTHPDIVSNILPYLKDNPNDVQTLAYAARVNKAWHRLYTAILWRDVYFDCRGYNDTIKKAPGPDCQRHRVHIRQFDINHLDEAHLHLIAGSQQQEQEQEQEQQLSWSLLFPYLESVRLTLYQAPVAYLDPFLRSVSRTLQRFTFYSFTDRPEEFVTALLSSTDDIIGGGGGGDGGNLAVLKELRLGFYLIGFCMEMSWASLKRLFEAFPDLETLDLGPFDLLAPPSPPSTNTIDKSEQEQEEEEEERNRRLQRIRSLHGQQQINITHLALRHLRMDSRTVLQLLSMTPRLTDLYINFLHPTVVVSVLGTLPTSCRDLKRLSIVPRFSASSSTDVMKLFQPANTTSTGSSSSLSLETLYLDRCEMDDSTLRQLISTHADSLIDLTLERCCQPTDAHVKAILSGCHRLKSLHLYGLHRVTLLHQKGDKAHNLVADARRKEWPCPASLKSLVVR